MSDVHALLREIVMQLSIYIWQGQINATDDLLCCTKILESVARRVSISISVPQLEALFTRVACW